MPSTVVALAVDPTAIKVSLLVPSASTYYNPAYYEIPVFEVAAEKYTLNPHPPAGINNDFVLLVGAVKVATTTSLVLLVVALVIVVCVVVTKVSSKVPTAPAPDCVIASKYKVLPPEIPA